MRTPNAIWVLEVWYPPQRKWHFIRECHDKVVALRLMKHFAVGKCKCRLIKYVRSGAVKTAKVTV